MVGYWIASSPWYEVAVVWEENWSWWYLPGRDNPKPGDKVVIYQPGNTRAAEKFDQEIKDEHKCKFIGNFTIGNLDPEDEAVRIKEKKIIWSESEFVDIYSVKDDLECTSEIIRRHGKAKWGLLFKNKTWVPISQRDYDLILSKRSGCR